MLMIIQCIQCLQPADHIYVLDSYSGIQIDKLRD